MALYDISQLTVTKSSCDAKASLLDKKTCLDTLLIQLREIEKSNVDALNGSVNESGTYAILKQFQANYAAQPIQKWLDLINTTKSEIAIREKRMTEARNMISSISSENVVIAANPVYQQELAAKETKDKQTRLIIGVVVVVLILGTIYIYNRIKKKADK